MGWCAEGNHEPDKTDTRPVVKDRIALERLESAVIRQSPVWGLSLFACSQRGHLFSFFFVAALGFHISILVRGFVVLVLCRIGWTIDRDVVAWLLWHRPIFVYQLPIGKNPLEEGGFLVIDIRLFIWFFTHYWESILLCYVFIMPVPAFKMVYCVWADFIGIYSSGWLLLVR